MDAASAAAVQTAGDSNSDVVQLQHQLHESRSIVVQLTRRVDELKAEAEAALSALATQHDAQLKAVQGQLDEALHTVRELECVAGQCFL